MHPEALHRFVDIPDVEDILKDKLTLPTGVTGIHDEINILTAGMLEDMAEPALGFFNGLKIEGSRDGGKNVKFPRKIFSVGTRWHLEFDKMPDCRGDDCFVVFEVSGIERFPLFLELAEVFGERAGEVSHD